MPAEKPNFILIHTDQHRADCVGLAGRRKGLYTPHMDQIGYRGMVFRQAYSTCPICIPQRLTLMTGQLAKTHGVLDNIGIPHFPMEHSLPGELAKGGYQTALVGRSMHTYPEDESYGWEYFLPGNPHSKTDYWAQYMDANAPKGSGGNFGMGTGTNSIYGIPWHLPDWMHNTHWTTERALEFLQEKRDTERPFCLSVGYYAPHGPLNPPEFHFNRYYQMEGLDEPAIGDWAIPPIVNYATDAYGYLKLDGECLRSTRAGYYGNISHVDAQVGRIMRLARSIPNTYIIFAGDHGEMLGDHYRFHKAVPYQGSVHVPFMMCGPDITPMQNTEATVGWHDIMPTLLDLAGLEIPPTVDGQSLVPLLHSGEAATWREYIHGEGKVGTPAPLPGQQTENNPVYYGDMQYLTDGKTKYIWFPRVNREMLFDLESDPYECHNLAGLPQEQDRLQLWRSRLVEELEVRPEGFTKDGKLVATEPVGLSREAEAIAYERMEQGYDIVYKKLPPRTSKTTLNR